MITALHEYGPRSYEQDIDTAWDHLLAAVRQTSAAWHDTDRLHEHPSHTDRSAMTQ